MREMRQVRGRVQFWGGQQGLNRELWNQGTVNRSRIGNREIGESQQELNRESKK